MKNKIFIFSTMLIFTASFCFSQYKSYGYIAIKGANIIPVVGDDIIDGIILIKGGLIEAIGKNVSIPPEAKIINASGQFAYPGMIDGYCHLGLIEISNVPAAVDYRELGRINPQLKAVEALRPDSVHIPIARANGITAALIAPSGGLISGQSGLIRLNGWTPEEMTIKSSVAMHIELSAMPTYFRGKEINPRENALEQIEELKEILNKVRYYQREKNAAQRNLLLPFPEFDEELEFLIPVVKGELPVMISVHADRDIKAAIKFVQEEKLEAIFFGVTQGWKVAEEIKKSGIPVVVGSLYEFPPKWEDGYDSLCRNVIDLCKAGVKFAFSSQGSLPPLSTDLPYQAGRAVAFGLDKKEALKGVTIYPAQIFGLSDKMGSLEKGKVANIVLTDGDIFEIRTNVKHLFISGKEVDLTTKYDELLEKFIKRD